MSADHVDQAACQRFEEDCLQQRAQPLESYLPPADAPAYRETVEALIAIELHHRWRTRPPGPLAETYLERFACLQEKGAVLRLAMWEYQARWQSGNTPALSEYRARFPQWIANDAELAELQNAASTLAPRAGHVLIECLPSGGTQTESRYTLTRLHAEGGLGRIWIARDRDLNREVALKELQPRRAGDPEAWQRFLQEAQVTGQLEHPNIVPVYELGWKGGREPFYTMRFVRGQTLRAAVADFHRRRAAGVADPLEQHRLLQAFVNVCHAISYAHSQGVIHRDLKPDNVVLGAFGEVLVLDWGLAKWASPPAGEHAAAGDTQAAGPQATVAGNVLGTPAYMSPEQAAGRVEQIDARTDIYGLGAILYEILTSRPPHQAETLSTLLSRIVRGPTPRVRATDTSAPRALDAICGRAMAMRPEDRYPDAAEVAREVQRFLADEPVAAHRESLAGRAMRWLRKHRTWAIAAAAAMVIVTATSVAAMVLINQQRQIAASARDRAETARANEALQRQEAERQARVATAYRLAVQSQSAFAETPQRSLLLAVEAVETTRRAGEPPLAIARQALVDALSASGGTVLHAPRLTNAVRRRGPLPLPPPSLRRKPPAATEPPPPAPLPPPPGAEAQPVGPAPEPRDVNWLDRVSFSAGGRWLAAANTIEYETARMGYRAESPSGNPNVYLWDLTANDVAGSRRTLEGPKSAVTALAGSADGRWLAAGSEDAVVCLWQLGGTPSLKPAGTLVVPEAHRRLETKVVAVNFSPDGCWLAACYEKGLVCLWPTGDELPTAPPFVLSHQQRPNGLACTARFSPNGRWLATFQAESNASELVRKALSGVFGPLPDEAEQRGVVLWDLAAADPTVAPRELPESRRQAICLAFDADGGRAAAGCMDGSVRIWSLGPDRPVKEPLKIQHVNPGVLGGKGIEDLAFSADRRFLLTAGMKDTRLWEFRPANGVEPAEDTPADDRPDAAPRLFGVYAAASRVLFGPQGRWFATSLDEGRSVRLYDLKLLEAIEDPEQVEMGEAGVALVNVEDEPVLVAVTHHDEQAELGTTVLRGHEGEVLAMATDAGGRRLVTSGADGTLRIWDLGRRTPFAIPRTLPRDERTPALPWAVAGKGGWLAAWPDNREDEQTVCLWNTETAAPVLGGTTTLKDAAAGADKAVLSNDGRWLAITAQEQGQPPPYSGVIRLYDLRSAQTPLAPRRLEIAAEQLVETLVLDPSDRWLAAAWGHPAVVRVWDLHADDPAQTHFDLTPHAGSVPMIAFTADGRRALTGCSDGVPRLWDLGAAQPGKTMTTLQAQEDEITAAAIRADGRYVAVGSKDGRLQLWALASGGRPAPPTMLHQFAVEVRCAAFSNDGRWLAAGAGEEPPRLWNLSAEKIAESARALPHPDASIEVVAFSPDGRWLVTGGARAIPAMVWDLTAADPSTTGIRLFRNWLPGELVVSQAVFLPRSPWLMTIGYDLVRLWPLEADELIGLARATAGRSLASDELQPAKESAPAPQATAKATPNATPP